MSDIAWIVFGVALTSCLFSFAYFIGKEQGYNEGHTTQIDVFEKGYQIISDRGAIKFVPHKIKADDAKLDGDTDDSQR